MITSATYFFSFLSTTLVHNKQSYTFAYKYGFPLTFLEIPGIKKWSLMYTFYIIFKLNFIYLLLLLLLSILLILRF